MIHRIFAFGFILSLVFITPLALTGCGGESAQVESNDAVKSIPGEVQLDKEFEPSAKKR